MSGQWIEVASTESFGGEPEASIRVQVGEHPIALFKIEQRFHALDDICSHEFSRLSDGEIWDGEVYCPKHGSRFNIETGTVKGLPAVKPVRSYPLKVEGERIMIRWDR